VSEIRAESFDRSAAGSWDAVQERIREIEREVFGEDAFSPDELRAAFTGPKNLAVLLRDGTVLVGYTQAGPARAPDTYYIANTAIAKSHQGRGLIRVLMERLYADVRDAGAHFIERDAAIANGYADKIVRFHAADIIRTRDHDSPYGRQRFIRMRVPGASGLG
jgi:GNAT superfamily N-acetyltransferase